MIRPNYKIYIVSPEWNKIANEIKKRDKLKCLACGSRVELTVHHGSYKNLGAEKGYELFTLCRTCHFSLHKKFKKKKSKDLFRHTEIFIRKQKKRVAAKKDEKKVLRRTNNFSDLFARFRKEYPKKKKEKMMVPFKSKNQLKVEKQRLKKIEKRRRRQERKNFLTQHNSK
jgi:hypothetical protein